MAERITLAGVHADVMALRKEVAASTAATRQLVEAWNAARTTVTFVKWVSGLVAALGVIWYVFRHGALPSS
jgi:hypothetical protein